uniref:Secreted protein n=1 Tax=Cacopsylla melanoneura TaxID=428564 RepID=A0A8D8WCU7_9HEMI
MLSFLILISYLLLLISSVSLYSKTLSPISFSPSLLPPYLPFSLPHTHVSRVKIIFCAILPNMLIRVITSFLTPPPPLSCLLSSYPSFSPPHTQSNTLTYLQYRRSFIYIISSALPVSSKLY